MSMIVVKLFFPTNFSTNPVFRLVETDFQASGNPFVPISQVFLP